MNRLEAAKARLADLRARDQDVYEHRLYMSEEVLVFCDHAPTDVERALAVVEAVLEQGRGACNGMCLLCEAWIDTGGPHDEDCPLAWWEGEEAGNE